MSSQSNRRRKSREPGASRSSRAALLLFAALLILIGMIGELAVLFTAGAVGAPTQQLLTLAAGWTAVLVPLWPAVVGGMLALRVLRSELVIPWGRLWGAAAAHLSLMGLFHVLLVGGPGGLQRAQIGQGGGVIGFAIGSGLGEAFGSTAAMLVLGAGLLLGLLYACGRTMRHVAGWAWGGLGSAWGAAQRARERRKQAIRIHSGQNGRRAGPLSAVARLVPVQPRKRGAAEAPTTEPARSNEADAPAAGQTGPRGEQWSLPPVSLFDVGGRGSVNQVDVRERARIIEETLESFNIEARVVEVNQGPTVTQYGIEPAAGVMVRKILALQNDLGLRLGAWPVRFEAPVPNKRVMGLEVPNQSVTTVALRDLLESEEAAKAKAHLRLALGRDVSGRAVVVDLTRMPHLLIAGATGSGKSVCINSLLASLLAQSTPDELQFLMIDPKMVEMMSFNGIPHLRMPVVTDMEQVVGSLKWVVREMERRYGLFVQRATRNIEGYNRQAVERGVEKPLPYLVVVVDELADMMMTAPDEVEILLCRLAQKARATGIHLIVATQRPSVDVLTGLIKANFVTRIAFAVSSQTDSRVILDTVGAEKLLGRGDMLFSSGDTSKPLRIQGAWVSDSELQKLVTFWRRQGLPRFTEADVQEMTALNEVDSADEGDELYERAVSVASQYSRVSTSLLQRRLGVGYPRAARLIDLMEERGAVAVAADGRTREVVHRDDPYAE